MGEEDACEHTTMKLPRRKCPCDARVQTRASLLLLWRVSFLRRTPPPHAQSQPNLLFASHYTGSITTFTSFSSQSNPICLPLEEYSCYGYAPRHGKPPTSSNPSPGRPSLTCLTSSTPASPPSSLMATRPTSQSRLRVAEASRVLLDSYACPPRTPFFSLALSCL